MREVSIGGGNVILRAPVKPYFGESRETWALGTMKDDSLKSYIGVN